jgi:alkylhydroperoxidase family enzyme
MSLSLYDIDNAPSEATADELRKSQEAFGFVPNLHKALAVSHEALAAYKMLHTAFQSTSFNSAELTVVWQTINNFHDCHYCIPAHTAIAHMLKVDETIINALHNGETVDDPKLSVLQATTLEITESRGHLSEATKQAFFNAGYGEKQLVEIVLGLSQKVLSNYINHLAETPLDEQFSEFAK